MRMRNSLFARVLGGSLIFWASFTVQEHHQIIMVKVPLAGEKVKILVSQSCLTLQPRGLYLTRLLCPWDSPGRNTGVDCHDLL